MSTETTRGEHRCRDGADAGALHGGEIVHGCDMIVDEQMLLMRHTAMHVGRRCLPVELFETRKVPFEIRERRRLGVRVVHCQHGRVLGDVHRRDETRPFDLLLIESGG